MEVLSIIKRRTSLGLLAHSDLEERFTQSKSELEASVAIALGGIAGGAISNLTDRVRLGAVVDFIEVHGWPSDFNLADAGIRLGVLAFLVALLLEWRRGRRPGTAAGPAP